MLQNIFRGVFDSEWMSVIDIADFFLCIVIALICGAIISLCYMHKNEYTQSYAVTLVLLPAVVCAVIMMVNGNIGAGVAVAGAFSLVRFRSAPGTAKEICTVFLAMGAGLIAGMGYLGYAVLFTLILSVMFVVLNTVGFGINRAAKNKKNLRITMPEDLDYTDVFDDIFSEYLSSFELVNVKTTNMGSMFKLTYDVVLKDTSKEKEMIDKIRCRNGNLEISISAAMTPVEEL